MSSRNPLPSKTEIQAFLRECGFDPRNQTEMRSLAVVTRPDFCEDRAIELINEAQLAVAQSDKHNQHYDQCLTRAIRLLILARMQRRRDQEQANDHAIQKLVDKASELTVEDERQAAIEEIRKLGPKDR